MYAFAEFRKRTKFVSKGLMFCFDFEKVCHYFAPFGICNDKTQKRTAGKNRAVSVQTTYHGKRLLR